jgi:hypothetical protein
LDKWREVTRRLLACFLGAAVLAACTPGGEAVVTETPSATASGSVTATASPSPSPSAGVDVLAQLPEDAKSPGLDGAIATAEFFTELYGAMLQTGDTSVWDALSDKDCGFCADASDTAAGYKSSQSTVTGGDTTVAADRSRASVHNDGLTYVGLVTTQAPMVVTASDGTSRTYDEATSGVIYQMTFDGDTWRILGGQIVDPAEVN